MKRTVVLLDSNGAYLKRLTEELNGRHGEAVDAHSFTEREPAVRMAKEVGADVIVAGEELGVSAEDIPRDCAFALFTNNMSAYSPGGQRTICRYRKAEVILQEIIELTNKQNSGALDEVFSTSKGGGIYTFVSSGGGAGGSTAAAAFSMSLASGNNRVIYINLERFGSSTQFFECEGSLAMSDVVYAIRGGKSDLTQRIKETIRCDETGVHFIESFRLAQEVSELKSGDIKELLAVLTAELHFDYVVVDVDLSIESTGMALLKGSSALVLVSDGTDASAGKFERIMDSLDIAFAREEINPPAMFLLYNKFSNKSGRNVNTRDLPLLGGVPKYEGASMGGIVRTIARSDVFDMLL